MSSVCLLPRGAVTVLRRAIRSRWLHGCSPPIALSGRSPLTSRCWTDRRSHSRPPKRSLALFLLTRAAIVRFFAVPVAGDVLILWFLAGPGRCA